MLSRALHELESHARHSFVVEKFEGDICGVMDHPQQRKFLGKLSAIVGNQVLSTTRTYWYPSSILASIYSPSVGSSQSLGTS